MRKTFLTWTLVWLTAACSWLTPREVEARRIEAVKGKHYPLTKQHGPWMIMVASLAEPPPELKVKGISPHEAAEQLVYELRRKGIPAYTYRQKAAKDAVETIDRFGRARRRRYTARQDRICVIAGNYNSVKDRTGQQTLAYIKTVYPKSWERSGVYRRTPGRPGPLSGAFMSINPKLSPDEVTSRQHDPLLLKLNAGSEYSLLRNRGQYSLVIATFYGKAATKIGEDKIRKAEATFKVGGSLNEAGENARQLATLLRSPDLAERLGNDYLNQFTHGKGFEAYDYHDHYRSVVTVGSFETQTDPGIRALVELFGAKVKRNSVTGQDVLTAEYISIPGLSRRPNLPFFSSSQNASVKSFVFDPKPQLMKVPTLR